MCVCELSDAAVDKRIAVGVYEEVMGEVQKNQVTLLCLLNPCAILGKPKFAATS